MALMSWHVAELEPFMCMYSSFRGSFFMFCSFLTVVIDGSSEMSRSPGDLVDFPFFSVYSDSVLLDVVFIVRKAYVVLLPDLFAYGIRCSAPSGRSISAELR